MIKQIRYGCIGTGGIAAKKHLNQYSQIDTIDIVAVCDVSIEKAERLARKYNIPRVYTDYKEMLKKEQLDLVSVCTPNYLHKPIIIEVLKNGGHVHCEKPMAITVEESEAIIKAKNKYGKKIMVGLNKRFTPESLLVKKYVEGDFFGEIYHAQCGWRRRAGIPGRGSWFTNKKLSGGGPMIDLGVHILDLTMYLMGYPQSRAVDATTYSKFSNSTTRDRYGYIASQEGIFDVEDMAVGFVRLENGATINFEFSWASNIEEESFYYELKGTKGGVSYINGEVKMFSEVMGTCVDVIPRINMRAKQENECEHFVDCIIEDKEPIATAEQALSLIKIIEASYKSAKQNKQVTITKEANNNVVDLVKNKYYG